MNGRQYPMATMHSATSVEDFDAGDSDILLGRTEQYPWQRWYREPQKMNKKPLYIVAAIVVVLFLSSAMYKTGAYMAADKMPAMSTVPEERIINRLSALNGPPTLKFRDNLNPNLRYISSWIDAGWTNDVITYMNLVYLAVITQRIAIMGVFTPSHIGFNMENIEFGKVFDVPRLSKLIGLPVLEWHEVKDRNSTEIDQVGCWDVWESVQTDESEPRKSRIPNIVGVDISYTKTPAWVKIVPNWPHDRHSSFFSLAALGYPEMRTEALAESELVVHESAINHVRLPPDEQLLCYDYLYYTATNFPFEFEYDYSPAWRFAGQHMHWAPELEKLADQYVRLAMGLSSYEPTPPYISIHARHSDFGEYCGDLPQDQCFASPAVIGRRIEEIRQELRERKNMEVQHVVMTSDERNATWWEDIRKQGWLTIDHSQTEALYGHWYPVLIDAVIQSNGVGFIGTDKSTMTVMARRRVQSWHDGPVRTVKWGTPTADDHRRRGYF
ncbi:hypothetical protein AX14_002926 [Amanita brunnescens Koide BX004]|nr:hypothetical protein AX14_002926 [Amanita brunnescens Koide BX004]